MSEDNGMTVVERLSRIRVGVIDLAIVSGMFVFVILLAAISVGYSADARAFPLLVSIVILPLIGLLLLRALEGVLGISVLPARLRSNGRESSTPDGEVIQSRQNTLTILGWIVLVVGSIYLVGMEFTLFVFLIGYYRYQVGLGWIRTVALSIFLWLFVVAIFAFVLGAPMPRGVIPELLLG